MSEEHEKMAETVEKKIEELTEEAKKEPKVEIKAPAPLEKVEEVEKKVEELTQEEKYSQLEKKCAALEKVSAALKAQIPRITQVGRPVHLSLIHKGFLYQLIVPEHALSHLENFADAHAMLSKFGVMLSQIETNAQVQLAKAEAEAAAKAEAEAKEQKPQEENK